MYVDGSLAGQIPIPGAGSAGIQMDGGAPIDFGDADVFLCARADENASRLFSGELSQLAFWNVPLTLAEVSTATHLACMVIRLLPADGQAPWAGLATLCTLVPLPGLKSHLRTGAA